MDTRKKETEGQRAVRELKEKAPTPEVKVGNKETAPFIPHSLDHINF